MNQVDEKLTYKTEEEKIDALQTLEEKGVTADDIQEIERISTAEIIGEKSPSEQSPAENLVEPDGTKQAPEGVTEQQGDETRNWQINEAIISKYDEEYTDENGRKRPFITHKNPDDFVKSYVHNQKNNHYLKTVRIPQEYDAGKLAAEKEYNEKLTAMQKELDELKAKPVEVKETVKSQEVAEHQSSVREEFNSLMTEIDNMPDDDSIENTDKLKRAIVLQNKLNSEMSAKTADKINEIVTNLTNQYDEKFDNYTKYFQEEKKKKQEEQEEKENARKEQEQKNSLRKVYNDIDGFAANPKFSETFKTDQTYQEMYGDATGFHTQLAELYTGKTRRDMSEKDWQNTVESAGSAYLSGLPELVNQANSIGLTEPRNYKTWVELDKIDAIRSGYWRNPQSQKWERRFDQITGQPINLGDLETAYNYMLDQTGQRDKMIQQGKHKEAQKVVNAINRRDKGVVQLDDSMMSQDGEGQVLTEEDAQKILDTSDVDFAIGEFQKGNKKPLDELNAALQRMGQFPITRNMLTRI